MLVLKYKNPKLLLCYWLCICICIFDFSTSKLEYSSVIVLLISVIDFQESNRSNRSQYPKELLWSVTIRFGVVMNSRQALLFHPGWPLGHRKQLHWCLDKLDLLFLLLLINSLYVLYKWFSQAQILCCCWTARRFHAQVFSIGLAGAFKLKKKNVRNQKLKPF